MSSITAFGNVPHPPAVGSAYSQSNCCLLTFEWEQESLLSGCWSSLWARKALSWSVC